MIMMLSSTILAEGNIPNMLETLTKTKTDGRGENEWWYPGYGIVDWNILCKESTKWTSPIYIDLNNAVLLIVVLVFICSVSAGVGPEPNMRHDGFRHCYLKLVPSKWCTHFVDTLLEKLYRS
jgi:hypothetical protein